MLYWRQKVLLSLLQSSPTGSATRLHVMKSLFLLRQEEGIGEDGSFYDFVPSKCGPFSFVAYRDIGYLECLGYLEVQGGCLRCTKTAHELALSPLVGGVARAVARVGTTYLDLPYQQLTRYVYRKYPWYASRSKLRSREELSQREADAGIYSLGYEGLSIDSFLCILLRAGIRAVVDSRNNPISRKYGFSRLTLHTRCTDFGLEYHAFPEVGIPAEARHSAPSKDSLWTNYSEVLLPAAATSVRAISVLCTRLPAVLICFERQREDCHRHILARVISESTGLPVINYLHEEGQWLRE